MIANLPTLHPLRHWWATRGVDSHQTLKNAADARLPTLWANHARLAQVAQHTWMDEVLTRCGGSRVGGGGLARLVEFLRQRGLAAMKRTGETVGGVVAKRRPGENEAEGSDRLQRCVDARIAAGGDGDGLQESVPGADACGFVRARCNEAPAFLGHRREAGPTDAAAPQSRRPSVEHHGGAVAGAVEIDRLEVAVGIQAESIEHIARQDDQAGAARAERDPLPAH